MVLNNQVQWFSGNQEKVESVVFMPAEGPEDLQRKHWEKQLKAEYEKKFYF